MSFYILIKKSDVNKKIKVGILLYILFVIILLTSSVSSFFFDNTNLVTDKNSYYNNEKIKINATWEQYYDPEHEDSYVRIQIIDIFDRILWNSSEDHSIGLIEKNWTVDIQLLNISYTNFTNALFIKMYNKYINSETGGLPIDRYRETVIIYIIKREVSCQLTNFKNVLIFGETNFFTATFFSTENSTRLINETFSLTTSYNEKILFQNNFTTNESGEIAFNISTISHLNIGRNELMFKMKNSIIYNDTTFSFDLIVKKIPVFVNVTKFMNNIANANYVEIQLYYYYIFNQSKKPIENENIKLIFYRNTISEYELNLMTNQAGFLDVKINPNNVIFQAAEKSIYVDIIFNGTSQLENNTITFNIELDNFSYQGISNSFFLSNISLISVLFMLLSIISLRVYNIHRTKFKLIRDLTFKF